MSDNCNQILTSLQFRGATRIARALLGAFAALAVTLAAVVIYGVLSYSVSRRRNHIGIRMTLGGKPADIFRLVAGGGLRVAVTGIACGIAAALALTRRYCTALSRGTPRRSPPLRCGSGQWRWVRAMLHHGGR